MLLAGAIVGTPASMSRLRRPSRICQSRNRRVNQPFAKRTHDISVFLSRIRVATGTALAGLRNPLGQRGKRRAPATKAALQTPLRSPLLDQRSPLPENELEHLRKRVDLVIVAPIRECPQFGQEAVEPLQICR